MSPHAVLSSLLVCPLLLSLAVCEVTWPGKRAGGQADPTQTPSPAPRPSSEAKREEAGEVVPPPMLSRKDWNAKEPAGEMKRHEVARITVHHTATAQKPDAPLAEKMRALQNFSQQESKLEGGRTKPAWPDVPYHFYVDARGRIAEGRNIVYAGDTNTDYDPAGHVLVVLEGNFEKERPTEAQLNSLGSLLRWLGARYGVPAAEIKGHGDYAATACPGKNLKSELPRLRAGAAGKGEQR